MGAPLSIFFWKCKVSERRGCRASDTTSTVPSIKDVLGSFAWDVRRCDADKTMTSCCCCWWWQLCSTRRLRLQLNSSRQLTCIYGNHRIMTSSLHEWVQVRMAPLVTTTQAERTTGDRDGDWVLTCFQPAAPAAAQEKEYFFFSWVTLTSASEEARNTVWRWCGERWRGEEELNECL